MISVAISLVIAVPIGFLAGYRGGLIDRLVQILVDVLLSVPPLILVFAIAGVLGPNVTNLVISLAVFFVPLFMRLTRQETYTCGSSNWSRPSGPWECPNRRSLGATCCPTSPRH